jgi:hypothetical protein
MTPQPTHSMLLSLRSMTPRCNSAGLIYESDMLAGLMFAPPSGLLPHSAPLRSPLQEAEMRGRERKRERGPPAVAPPPSPPQSVTPFPSPVRFDGDAEGQIYCSSPSSPARMKLSVTGRGGGGKKGSQKGYSKDGSKAIGKSGITRDGLWV